MQADLSQPRQELRLATGDHEGRAAHASITDIDAYNMGSPAASGATEAATIAQTAASGLIINCRDVPKMA